MQAVVEGFAFVEGADEGEFVEAVAEDGVGAMELMGEFGDFGGDEFVEGVFEEGGFPVGEEFEVDAAGGLVPEEDLGVAGGEPEEAFAAVEAPGEAGAEEVPEALGVEGAWVAEDGAADVVVGGVAGVDGGGGVGPGVGEEAGAGEVELAGAEEFGGGDLAVGGGVDLGAGVEEFEGFQEEGEVFGADAVGFGEDEGGGELDLFSEKVFGGAGAGVFVVDEAFEESATGGVVFDEGFGVDEGDEGVDVVGGMAGDFFDEGPGVGGA